MKYCKKNTEKHPLSINYPQYLNKINDIIKNENGTHQPFNNEVALKLDEIKESSENKDVKNMKFMDMVLGMKDGTTSLSLLVELKLGCKKGFKGHF